MARKIVTVDEQLHLPPDVEDALKSELHTTFSTMLADSTQARNEAVDAAERAEEAAETAVAPTDIQVTALLEDEESATRVALDQILAEQGVGDVATDIQTPGSDIDLALRGLYALKPTHGDTAVGKGELMVSVADYNPLALGGAVADRVAIQNAINEAASTGRAVFFPRATYTIGSSLTVPSGTVLIGNGSTIQFNFSGSGAIEISGSVIASGTLTQSKGRGNVSIPVNTAQHFAVGDWVRIRSDALLNSDTNQKKGEFVRVASVSSQLITSLQPLQDAYLTTDNAGWDLFDFRHSITISGLIFDGGTTTGYGIRMRKARDIVITDCQFRNCNYAGIRAEDVVNLKIANCDFKDSQNTTLCYGFGAFYAVQNVTMTNCTASNVRHMVALGGGGANYGAPRQMVFSNCVASGCTNAGFDTHSAARDIVFSNCIVVGSYEGFYSEGTRISFIGCAASQVERYGFALIHKSTDPFEFNISGCRGRDLGSHGIRVDNASGTTCYGGVISNSQLSSVGATGIYVSGSGGANRNISISGNGLVNTGGVGIALNDTAFGAISGNTMTAGGDRGIQVSGSARTTVAGNSIRCVGGTAVLIASGSTSVVVSGNLGEDVTTGVSATADSSTVLVTGNNFDGAAITLAGSGSVANNNL